MSSVVAIKRDGAYGSVCASCLFSCSTSEQPKSGTLFLSTENLLVNCSTLKKFLQTCESEKRTSAVDFRESRHERREIRKRAQFARISRCFRADCLES